jgi:hypothetical protein
MGKRFEHFLEEKKKKNRKEEVSFPPFPPYDFL